MISVLVQFVPHRQGRAQDFPNVGIRSAILPIHRSCMRWTRKLQEVSAKEQALADREAALTAAQADADFARSEADALIAAQKVQ